MKFELNSDASAVFIVNFEHISNCVLVFLLLTLTRQMPAGLDYQMKLKYASV